MQATGQVALEYPFTNTEAQRPFWKTAVLDRFPCARVTVSQEETRNLIRNAKEPKLLHHQAKIIMYRHATAALPTELVTTFFGLEASAHARLCCLQKTTDPLAPAPHVAI